VPPIETDIPARLDRLPWSRWHWRVIIALGITWILDGLEVTVVGGLGGVLQEPDTLHLSATEVGLAGTFYLAGAIFGALFFGRLTDAGGRKKLFLVTLGVYVSATAATALSWNFASFAMFRAITGMGIGGEGAAMSSAIDELIPARVRGFVGISLNGSYWIGAMLGAATSVILLSPHVLGHRAGWRATFGLGALLGGCILIVRRYLPESPRWLLVHGRPTEAEFIVEGIEAVVAKERGPLAPVDHKVRISGRGRIGFSEIARLLLGPYRRRTFYGLTLMVAQAFFYNAIFFTYALVLGDFYRVPSEEIGWYLLPFAAGNFLGPLTLGRLFDRVGRRQMISVTYALSAILLAVTGILFEHDLLSATTQTLLWSLLFFIASAAASSAYLTVSEVFPLEIRALAIALFYAAGTGVGGLLAPAIFGALIATGQRSSLMIGYLAGAALMLIAAGVAWRYGIAAERRSLEEIAAPLSLVRPDEAPFPP
jgi:MFS family permease